ncbi:MAG: hypothetical protein ACOWWR_13585 [Eubacteriales bacterium]
MNALLVSLCNDETVKMYEPTDNELDLDDAWYEWKAYGCGYEYCTRIHYKLYLPEIIIDKLFDMNEEELRPYIVKIITHYLEKKRHKIQVDNTQIGWLAVKMPPLVIDYNKFLETTIPNYKTDISKKINQIIIDEYNKWVK